MGVNYIPVIKGVCYLTHRCQQKIHFKSDFSELVCLFLEKEEGREKERERNIDWLPVPHTWPGTKPMT